MKKIDDAINVMRKGDPSLLTEEDVMMGCLALMQMKSLKDILNSAIAKEDSGRYNIVQIVKIQCYKTFEDMIDESIKSIEHVHEEVEDKIIWKE